MKIELNICAKHIVGESSNSGKYYCLFRPLLGFKYLEQLANCEHKLV